MTLDLLHLGITFQNLSHREEAQDLMESAIVVSLIALAATAGMTSVATAINTAFTNIRTAVTTYMG